MLLNHIEYQPQDHEAIKILEDFLPDRIFDAHLHLFDTAFLPQSHHGERSVATTEAYRRAMLPMLCHPRELRLNIIPYPDRTLRDADGKNLAAYDAFLVSELEKDPTSVGEIIILPHETEEQIEARLVHPRIRGLKCYFNLAEVASPNHCVSEFLSENAWRVADRHGLCITLHLMREKSLSDPENLACIQKMAARYPNARLILAHAARAFAAWTGVEAVAELAHLPNVWFDFSAICESPALLRILQKIGVGRCMWGSDFPVSAGRGKAISLGTSFYWLNESHLPDFSGLLNLGIENLLAVRQACILADLTERDVERIFYTNASEFWSV